MAESEDFGPMECAGIHTVRKQLWIHAISHGVIDNIGRWPLIGHKN